MFHGLIRSYIYLMYVGVHQIVNETINAGITEQSFSLGLIRNNNVIECTKSLNLTMSTSETCKATTKNNSMAKVFVANDDGKILNMSDCTKLSLCDLLQWEH